MKLRMPSIPLFTIDPYFSVWSKDDINKSRPTHWTGSNNTIRGLVFIDGEEYLFLGGERHKIIPQVSIDADALSTTAVFRNDKIELTAVFTSPLMADSLYYSSRPVSYLKLFYKSVDGLDHKVTAKLSVSEELVLNKAGEGRAWSQDVELKNGACVKMGNGDQSVLWRNGDDVRIDWGFLYLAVNKTAKTGNEVFAGLYSVYAETDLENDALFALAYDDIKSIQYFGENLDAYWKKDGKTITQAIDEAICEYDELYKKCCAFSSDLWDKAVKAGGEKYAELLSLAYRQVMAAHKLVVDKEGNNLYISKECFSNGCAATVDVTYPSAPMYLYYNTELLKGMIRPVMRFAASEAWPHDFAPHDVGKYPLLNGQVYYGTRLEGQMPVEECGNILTLMGAITDIDGNADFAAQYIDILEKWNEYLIDYGYDPENQLCTDDFAGHLAHNCNLSIKAIMGMAGFAKVLKKLGRDDEADALTAKAKEYADSFIQRAANPDGSYRLAYDRPDTFSLKYNAVWDKVWKLNMFPAKFYSGETERYKKEALPYGVPLDSREKYTKSDWLLWVAAMAEKQEDFEYFVDLLWSAFNTMRTRVPMTDWYFTDTSEMRGFRHRTVQGGLFIKLLMK